MIDLNVRFDLGAMKQIVVYGILLLLISKMYISIVPQFPSYGEIGGYVTWAIAFTIFSLIYGLLSIAILKGSEMVVKRFWK